MGKSTIPTPAELVKSGALVGACISAQSMNALGKSVMWGIKGAVTVMLDTASERPYTLGRDMADNGMAAERSDQDGTWEPEVVDISERYTPSIGKYAVEQSVGQDANVVPLDTAREQLQARILLPHQSV